MKINPDSLRIYKTRAHKLLRVFHNLYEHRSLIRILTMRDFRARYIGSLGGGLWALAQPLFMVLVYTMVFSRFLGVKFGVSDSPFAFAVFLLCALLPWNAFAESFSTATNLIRANSHLVKKAIFPVEVLPVNLILVTMITQVIGTVILIPLVFMVNNHLFWTLLFVPIIMILQFLFYTGIVFFWTGFSVFLPDLRQITIVLISALPFLAPIFYPLESIPKRYLFLINLNPFTHLVTMYRDVIMQGKLPSWQQLLGFAIFSLLVFIIGYGWFQLYKREFADIL